MFVVVRNQVERARSAGMLLKQLCTTQGEELKALKEAFPAIFKEMSEIQETNYKQEKELDTVQTVITPLQAEIASLQERIACLTADLKQVHPPLHLFGSQELFFVTCFKCALQSIWKFNISSEIYFSCKWIAAII